MSCYGPCLPHCFRCPKSTNFLASAAVVYLIASVVYLVMSRSLQTPFLDSLDADQRKVYAESFRKRAVLFKAGILVGLLFLAVGGASKP